ncbi:MAG: hypothetical protein ABIC04_08130 [Nanoarchaeota archaeon]
MAVWEHSEKLVGLVIDADKDIVNKLGATFGVIEDDDQGDRTDKVEGDYAESLGEVLKSNGCETLIIAESPGKPKKVTAFSGLSPEIICFIDQWEGSTNREGGRLVHGYSILFFQYAKRDVRVKQYIGGIIGDRLNNVIYKILRNKNGGYMEVSDHGIIRKPIRRDGFRSMEVPDGYTKRKGGFDVEYICQSVYYDVIRTALKNNQKRVLESTAVRCASVVDGDPTVYVEGRLLEKLGFPFDLVGAYIAVNLAGGKATTLDNKHIWERVVYDEQRFPHWGGVNPKVMDNIIATHYPEDHAICVNAIGSVLGKEFDHWRNMAPKEIGRPFPNYDQ